MGWKYIKGTEKDFENAPNNALQCISSDKGFKDHLVGWLTSDNMLVGLNGYKEEFTGLYGYRKFVNAERVWEEEKEVETPSMNKKNDISEPAFLPAEQEVEVWNGNGIPPTGTICKLKAPKEFYTHDGAILFPIGTMLEVGGVVHFKQEGEMIAVKIKGTSCRDTVHLKMLMPC